MAYQAVIRDAYLKNIGTINYDITPDYGTPIFPGDTVTISGTARWTEANIRSIGFYYPLLNADTDSTDWYGKHQYAEAYTNVSISKGGTGSFTLSFQIPEESYSGMTERFQQGPYDKDFFYTGRWYQFKVFDAKDGENSKWTYLAYTDICPAPFLYGQYPLDPQILSFDFERAALSGSNYGYMDDGQYLMCKSLRISKSARAAVEDITTARIVCSGSDGSTRTVNLTQAQITAALSTSGYSETSPSIFAGFTSALGVTYTLTLIIGDAYDQVSFADTVMRSFARFHLSGAKKGGVAIGKFSAATDDQPLFEVAEDHESVFYGGIRGVTNYVAGEQPTGGKWIDGKEIYRYVATGKFSSAGADAVLATIPNASQIDTVLSMRGVLHLPTSASPFRPIPYIDRSSTNATMGLSINTSGGIVLGVGTSYSGYTGNNAAIVIVEYTKA